MDRFFTPPVWIALAILGAVLINLGMNALTGVSRSGGGQEIVVVDITRIVNAQRMLISEDIASSSPGEGAMLANRAGQVAEQTIREVAGRNAIVLIKQAVIGSDLGAMDITDAVLKRLSLPVDAPSIGEAAINQYHMRGTGYAGSPMYQHLEEQHQRREAAARQALERERANEAGSILP